jgi:hypothetical protein
MCLGHLLNTAIEHANVLSWDILEAHEGQAAYGSIQNISGLPQGLAGRPAAG